MTVPVGPIAGVDVGTTHLKAGIYTLGGAPLAESLAPTPDDADLLQATAARLLRECAAAVATPPVVVGVSSMAETGVPLDRAGRPLSGLIRWSDPRGAEQAAELLAEVGAAAWFGLTGTRVSAKLPIAKWRWMSAHSPDTARRMRLWAGAADLVQLALADGILTSPTLAGRTGGYDIRAGTWATDLLALAAVSPEQLPAVARAGLPLSRGAAEATGLPAGVPVVVAGHDHPVAAYAAGVRRAGEVADSMGTAEAVITPVDTAAGGELWRHGVNLGPYVDGHRFCLISGLGSSGGLVDWWLERFGPPTGYDAFVRLAADVVRPTGIVVAPHKCGSPPGLECGMRRVAASHTPGGSTRSRGCSECRRSARLAADPDMTGAPGRHPQRTVRR